MGPCSMIQKGYNGLPKPQRFLVVYRKRDGERELLKDRSQMAVLSLITAFGTLPSSSMEQRGPTVASCQGLLISHPHARSAHAFSTASPWTSQERSRSRHSHPMPGMLCTLWSPLIQPQPVLTSEPCSFCGRCGLAWERITSQPVGERHCPVPATWDTTCRHCEGPAAVFQRQTSNKQLAPPTLSVCWRRGTTLSSRRTLQKY